MVKRNFQEFAVKQEDKNCLTHDILIKRECVCNETRISTFFSTQMLLWMGVQNDIDTDIYWLPDAA